MLNLSQQDYVKRIEELNQVKSLFFLFLQLMVLIEGLNSVIQCICMEVCCPTCRKDCYGL